MKKIVILIISFFIYCNISFAEILKIGKLKIELFDDDKLIQVNKSIVESFGRGKIKIFAEKNQNNEINSLITVFTWKGEKYGSDMRNFFLDYFYKNKNGLFYDNDINNLKLNNDKLTNAVVIKEIDLGEYLKQKDDFAEFKRTIKKLSKKHNVALPDRVIKSDHIYIKGGDLIWIGHMYNYKNVIKEDVFVDKLTKYHPNIIENYPNFLRSMEKWIKLSLKRHQEFQDKLKIKVKIDLNLERFDLSQNLEDLKNDFYSSNFANEEDRNLEKEQKAKEQKEKKAKEEKERKAKEEKERKAKEEKERKAKEQKAKEQKAKEEKERKAKEQKAKEEKSKAEDEISVDDLMSKIKELNEMYKSGLITKDEFEMLKNKLLKN